MEVGEIRMELEGAVGRGVGERAAVYGVSIAKTPPGQGSEA